MMLPLTEPGSIGKKQGGKSGQIRTQFWGNRGSEKLSPKVQGKDVNPLYLITARHHSLRQLHVTYCFKAFMRPWA